MPSIHDPALHLLPAPIVVVGAEADGVAGGLTAAWVMRVSSEPPLVALAVAPSRFTHGLLEASGVFSLSVLREDQVAEGRLFGLASRRDVEKWSRVDHVLLEGGVPALARCAARFCCRITDRLPAGDHEVFVAEILTSEVVDGGPALPMRGADWIP